MKDIEDYEGLYAITEDGRVWSHRSKKFLRPTTLGKGYAGVSLSSAGVVGRFYVHRLVATAFIPNPEGKHTVNHKDGNKVNNCVSNLEWATHQEQIDHAIETGLSELEGEANGYAKLTDEKVIEIRTKYSTKKYSHEVLAQEYGVTRACILKVVRGRSWLHLAHDKSCDVARWRDRGANHSAARWTAEQVREIRIKYATGNYTTRSLAAEYGGTSSGICAIINFKSYADQDHDLRRVG